MSSWIVTFSVVMVFAFIMVPIERAIYKRISRKWLAYIVTFLVGLVLLLSLYGLSGLIKIN